jgi:hypothetical protein
VQNTTAFTGTALAAACRRATGGSSTEKKKLNKNNVKKPAVTLNHSSPCRDQWMIGDITISPDL